MAAPDEHKHDLHSRAVDAVVAKLRQSGVPARRHRSNFNEYQHSHVTANAAGRNVQIIVAAKQKKAWPQCKGVPPGDNAMVLVDYQCNRDAEYYVLTPDDWREFIVAALKTYTVKTGFRTEIKPGNVPVNPDQPLKNGKPLVGYSVVRDEVQTYRDDELSKIVKMVNNEHGK